MKKEIFTDNKKKRNNVKVFAGAAVLVTGIVLCSSFCCSEAEKVKGEKAAATSVTTTAPTTTNAETLPVAVEVKEEKFDVQDLMTTTKEYKEYLDKKGNEMTKEMSEQGIEADFTNTITEEELRAIVFVANIEDIDSEEREKMISSGLIPSDPEKLKTDVDTIMSYIMSSNAAYIATSEVLEKEVNTDLLISLDGIFEDEKDIENAKELHNDYVNMIGKDKDTIVASYMNTRDFMNYSPRTDYPYSIHENTVGAKYILRTVYGFENLIYATDYLPQVERDAFQESLLNTDEFVSYLNDVCGIGYTKTLTK